MSDYFRVEKCITFLTPGAQEIIMIAFPSLDRNNRITSKDPKYVEYFGKSAQRADGFGAK